MRKLVSTLNSSHGVKTKTYWHSDYEEFQVELYVGKALQTEATYYTANCDDALGTAAQMVKQHEKKLNAEVIT
jgi:hypothetical protein